MANEQEDEFIDAWFPELQTETYFIPPVDLNPEAHVQRQIAGQTVLIPLDPRQHREYRRAIEDDLVQRRVLTTIRALANKNKADREASRRRDRESCVHQAGTTSAALNPTAHTTATAASGVTIPPGTKRAATNTPAAASTATNAPAAASTATNAPAAASTATNPPTAASTATNAPATRPVVLNPSGTTSAATSSEASRSQAGTNPTTTNPRAMNSDKEKHGMVVLSQVKCSDFNRRSLVSAPDFKNSAEPAEGDFDLMILHRQYGVLIGSIKTASNRAVDVQRVQLDEAITYLDVTERDVKKLVEKVLVEQIVAKLPRQERKILAREIVEKMGKTEKREVSQNKPQTDQVLGGRHAESVLEEVSLAVVDQHTRDWVRLLSRASAIKHAEQIAARGRDRSVRGTSHASIVTEEGATSAEDYNAVHNQGRDTSPAESTTTSKSTVCTEHGTHLPEEDFAEQQIESFQKGTTVSEKRTATQDEEISMEDSGESERKTQAKVHVKWSGISEKKTTTRDQEISESEEDWEYFLQKEVRPVADGIFRELPQWSKEVTKDATFLIEIGIPENTTHSGAKGPSPDTHGQLINKQLRKMIEDRSQIPELLSEVTRLVTCQLYGILTADLVKEVTEYFLREVTTLMTKRLTEELEQEVRASEGQDASERILTQLAHGIFQQMSVGKTKMLNNLSSIVNLELLQKFRDKLSHTTANLLSHEVVAELMEDTVLAYVSQLPEKTTLHLPKNIGRQLTECVVRLLAKTVTRQLAERVVGQVLESTVQQLLEGIENDLVQARQQISNDFIGKVTDTLFFRVVDKVETDIRAIVEKRKELFRDKTELSEEDVQQLWKNTEWRTNLTVENTQWVADEMRRNMQDGETRNLSLLLLRRLTQEEVERRVRRFTLLPSLTSLTKKISEELSRQLMEKCSLTLQGHVAGRTRQLLASSSGSAVKEHVKQVLDEFSPHLNAILSRRMVTELSNHVTRQLADSDDHRTQSVKAMSEMVFTYLSDESVSRDVAKRLVDLMTGQGLDSVLDKVKRPRILKTVILPHVWDKLLTVQLQTYPELGQKLARCLGEPDLSDMEAVTRLCLCQEMMPVPEYMQLHQNDQNDHHNDLPDDAMKKAEEWWRWRMVGDGEDPNMTDELYRGLVRRFCTPVTSVQYYCSTEPRRHMWHEEPRRQVWSESQAVSTIGGLFTRLALYPSQVDVLLYGDDMLFLTGPPGTGKTVMLVLKARRWLQEGEHVYVTCLEVDALAAAYLIISQLRQMAPDAAGRIHLLDMRKFRYSMSAALRDVVLNVGGKLNIIADEAGGDTLKSLCDVIMSDTKVTQFRLWAASVLWSAIPECLQKVTLTEPLRCPPVVVQEVIQADEIQVGIILKYSEPPTPPPAEGQPVITIEHADKGRGRDCHSGEDPPECQQCGMELGRSLRKLVGDNNNGNFTSISTTASGLSYRDVFVLTRRDPYDEETDVTGNVTRPASGAVTGLRRLGIPVRVVRFGDDEGVREVAEMVGGDVVTVTSYETVWGLERKVVAVMGGKMGEKGDKFYAKLLAMSRAVSQLIYVKAVP